MFFFAIFFSSVCAIGNVSLNTGIPHWKLDKAVWWLCYRKGSLLLPTNVSTLPPLDTLWFVSSVSSVSLSRQWHLKRLVKRVCIGAVVWRRRWTGGLTALHQRYQQKTSERGTYVQCLHHQAVWGVARPSAWKLGLDLMLLKKVRSYGIIHMKEIKSFSSKDIALIIVRLLDLGS